MSDREPELLLETFLNHIPPAAKPVQKELLKKVQTVINTITSLWLKDSAKTNPRRHYSDAQWKELYVLHYTQGVCSYLAIYPLKAIAPMTWFECPLYHPRPNVVHDLFPYLKRHSPTSFLGSFPSCFSTSNDTGFCSAPRAPGAFITPHASSRCHFP